MSTVKNTMYFPGRIYSNDDLHAAGLIAIDRRQVIQETLVKDFSNVDPVVVASIARSALFLLSCNEAMFSDIEAGK